MMMVLVRVDDDGENKDFDYYRRNYFMTMFE